MASVGEKLKNLRNAKKMTQMSLAKKSGVVQQVISQYESGRNAIGIRNLAKLAAALECSVSDIDARITPNITAEKINEPYEKRRLYIHDDMLLYICNNWQKLPLNRRAEIMAEITTEVKNTHPVLKTVEANSPLR
ncbi:MAG: helix-turn-helix domain-containing protein [Planctomycetota bacterium]|jgi:transcriptional regulator with XRE-family HTH domain|nr:helix-turn-helix domain-containing protein [Planctomycetota bacterium]